LAPPIVAYRRSGLGELRVVAFRLPGLLLIFYLKVQDKKIFGEKNSPQQLQHNGKTKS
jgi:hypothetical protein